MSSQDTYSVQTLLLDLRLFHISADGAELLQTAIPVRKSGEFSVEVKRTGSFLLEAVTSRGFSITRTEVEHGAALPVVLELSADPLPHRRTLLSGKAVLGELREPIVVERISWSVFYPLHGVNRGSFVTDERGRFHGTIPTLFSGAEVEFCYDRCKPVRLLITQDMLEEQLGIHRSLRFDFVERRPLRIITKEGHALRYAMGRITSLDDERRAYCVPSDRSGVIDIGFLDDGNYKIRIEAPNFMGFSGKSRTESVSLNVKSGEGKGWRGLDRIEFGCGRNVTIVAKDEEQNRIRDFCVMIQDVTSEDMPWLVGGHHLWDNEGRPAIRSEQAGEVVLSGLPRIGEWRIVGFSLTEPQRFGTGSFVFHKSGSGHSVELFLKRAKEVSVLIEGEHGQLVESVRAIPANPAFCHSMWREEETEPLVRRRMAWEYIVPEKARGLFTLHFFEDMDDGLFVHTKGAGALVKGAGELTYVTTLRLESRIILTGRVIQRSGSPGNTDNPVLGARVRLSFKEGRIRETYSAAEGWFGFYVGREVPLSIEVMASRRYKGRRIEKPRAGIFHRIVVEDR